MSLHNTNALEMCWCEWTRTCLSHLARRPWNHVRRSRRTNRVHIFRLHFTITFTSIKSHTNMTKNNLITSIQLYRNGTFSQLNYPTATAFHNKKYMNVTETAEILVFYYNTASEGCGEPHILTHDKLDRMLLYHVILSLRKTACGLPQVVDS